MSSRNVVTHTKAKKPTRALAVSRDTVMIPVDQLVTSKQNVRKTGGQSIEELAASLIAHGQINNLVVCEADAGKFAVIAGGRRLRAFQHLVKTKQLPKSYEVRCIVVDGQDAIDKSLAENVAREAMHGADEFEAYKKLADANKTPAQIAADFGVSEVHVKQRLKLAKLAPEFLDLYREGKANVEQLIALSITDDHDRQRSVWLAARVEWQRSPGELRGALTREDATLKNYPPARYVGLAAYEKAGGQVSRDLFSDDVYLTDRALIDQLAIAKLDKRAAKVRAEENPAWVEAQLSADYDQLRNYGTVATKRRDPTPKEAKALTKLQEQQEALSTKMEVEDQTQDEYDELEAQWGEVQEKIEALEASMTVEDETSRAIAGTLVYLDQSGNVIIKRGLIKPEDKKAATKAQRSAAGSGESGEAVAPSLSDALARRLSVQHTLALRAQLSNDPDLAIKALAHALILHHFYIFSRLSALEIHPSAGPLLFAHEAPERGKSRAEQVLSEREDELRKFLPTEESELWGWVLSADDATVQSLLAFCVAQSVNAVTHRSDDTYTTDQVPLNAVHALANTAGLDMADWWTPTAETYLSSVPKSHLAEIVTEARGADVGKPIAGMKKGDAVKAAEDALQGSRWIPAAWRQA